MYHESFGSPLCWAHDHLDEECHDIAEEHFTYVHGDCAHLAENGGTCAPEHGGCPHDCAHYVPSVRTRRKERVH